MQGFFIFGPVKALVSKRWVTYISHPRQGIFEAAEAPFRSVMDRIRDGTIAREFAAIEERDEPEPEPEQGEGEEGEEGEDPENAEAHIELLKARILKGLGRENILRSVFELLVYENGGRLKYFFSWLVKKNYFSSVEGLVKELSVLRDSFDEKNVLFNSAISSGSLPMLKYLFEQVGPQERPRYMKLSSYQDAPRLNMLKYLVSLGLDLNSKEKGTPYIINLIRKTLEVRLSLIRYFILQGVDTQLVPLEAKGLIKACVSEFENMRDENLNVLKYLEAEVGMNLPSKGIRGKYRGRVGEYLSSDKAERDKAGKRFLKILSTSEFIKGI